MQGRVSRETIGTSSEGIPFAMNQGPDHIGKTEARAGTTPHMARYVLFFGLTLTILAFVIIYLIWM